MNAIIVFTTVPDDATADKIASQLVDHRLAACVHCLPAGRSVYRWQGRIESATERTLMIKSTTEKWRDIEHAIQTLHPYDVPELVCVPISAGSAPYLKWIADETA
jgi:periplasmic divalent cation tolerance protein